MVGVYLFVWWAGIYLDWHHLTIKIPLYCQQCNASIGCNAKGLILTFKWFYSQKMFTFQRKEKPDHVYRWSLNP